MERLETLAGQQGRTLDDVFGELLNSYAPIGSGNWALALAEGMEAADVTRIDDPDASMNSRDCFEWHLREKWERIYPDWQKTFQRVIELTEQLPEDKLMEEGRYPFMGGYRFVGQIATTWDHHGEHLRDLKTHLGISPESK